MCSDVEIADIAAAVAYDPLTGALTWRADGRPAFSTVKSGGYLHGQFAKRFIKAHRVAWALHNGHWPVGYIDHIDGDRSNNRIANLREATARQNSANGGKRPGRQPSSRFIGVCITTKGNKWEASVGHEGRTVRAGLFADETEAARARDSLAIQLKGRFARLNFPQGESA